MSIKTLKLPRTELNFFKHTGKSSLPKKAFACQGNGRLITVISGFANRPHHRLNITVQLLLGRAPRGPSLTMAELKTSSIRGNNAFKGVVARITGN